MPDDVDAFVAAFSSCAATTPYPQPDTIWVELQFNRSSHPEAFAAAANGTFSLQVSSQRGSQGAVCCVSLKLAPHNLLNDFKLTICHR